MGKPFHINILIKWSFGTSPRCKTKIHGEKKNKTSCTLYENTRENCSKNNCPLIPQREHSEYKDLFSEPLWAWHDQSIIKDVWHMKAKDPDIETQVSTSTSIFKWRILGIHTLRTKLMDTTSTINLM